MKDFLDLIVWGVIHSLAILVGMNSLRTVPHPAPGSQWEVVGGE